MTRTSILTVFELPTGSNSPSCRTRSSFVCVSSGKLAHLVEEQRAAVGQLESADAPLSRAGERAFHVAEQFAFDQARGDGAAVELHERSIATRAALVDGAGDELLARAGLAVDQYARVRAGDEIDLAQRLLQGRARADDLAMVTLFGDLALQIAILPLQPLLQALDFLERVLELGGSLRDALLETGVGRGEIELQTAQLQMRPHARQHFLVLERLDHVVGAAGREPSHLVLQVAEGCHEDHRDIGRRRALPSADGNTRSRPFRAS